VARGVVDGVVVGVGGGVTVVTAVGDGTAGGGADGDPVHAAAPSATTAATAARPRTPRRYGTSTRRAAGPAEHGHRAGIGSEAMTDEPRWLPLDGAANARDLGGLPTEAGGETAPGRLLRSDNLQGLTPGDVRLLVDDVGLRTVVDLRTDVEVELEGPGPLTREPLVDVRHLTLFPESGGRTDVDADTVLPWQAGGEDARRGSALPDTPPGEAPEPGSRAIAFYLAYLRDRPDNVVAALRAIADSDGATIVHCAAGKDRTGVVVALALSVAGVPRDRIVADYVATADRMRPLLARLKASDTYREDLDSRPDDSHRPRAETMRRFLAHLDEHCGGPLGWLESAGFGPADMDRLRSRLVPSAVPTRD
jgi:protein-tyrosine phosphatase